MAARVGSVHAGDVAIDLLLLQHGPSVAVLVVLGAMTLGAIGSAIRATRRALRAKRGLRARAAGAHVGIAHAQLGDRVIVQGHVDALCDVRAIDGRWCAATTTACGGAELHEHAAGLSVRVAARSLDISGPLSIEAAPGERTLDASTIGVAQLVRLADAGVHPDLGPIASRAIARGDRVLLLGRVEGIAGEGSGYRHSTRTLGIAPDEDGVVHAVGLGSPIARAGAAALVAGLIAAIALSAGAMASLSSARGGLPLARSLPRMIWLPLAFPPTREEAISRASEWSNAALARSSDHHLIELAHALRALRPDCDREAWLAIREGDGYDDPDDDCDARMLEALVVRFAPEDRALRQQLLAHARASQSIPADAPRAIGAAASLEDARAARSARARAWDVPEVAPSAEVNRPELVYEVPAAMLRSGDPVASPSPVLRGWLRDVALLEAALGHHDRAQHALHAARTSAPNVDDVVVGVALVLASRADLRRSTWNPRARPSELTIAVVARHRTRPPSYERDILDGIGRAGARPKHQVGIAVGLLRAAGAAYLLDARDEAAWLADRAIRHARALPSVDRAASAALFDALP